MWFLSTSSVEEREVMGLGTTPGNSPPGSCDIHTRCIKCVWILGFLRFHTDCLICRCEILFVTCSVWNLILRPSLALSLLICVSSHLLTDTLRPRCSLGFLFGQRTHRQHGGTHPYCSTDNGRSSRVFRVLVTIASMLCLWWILRALCSAPGLNWKQPYRERLDWCSCLH